MVSINDLKILRQVTRRAAIRRAPTTCDTMSTMRMPVAILIVLAIVACRSQPSHQAHQQTAPDPNVCVVDADCTFGVGIDESGCCLATNSSTAGAHNVTFARWVTERASSPACRDAKCAPMPPMPPPPGACWNEPKCKSGRCGDAC